MSPGKRPCWANEELLGVVLSMVLMSAVYLLDSKNLYIQNYTEVHLEIQINTNTFQYPNTNKHH